MTQPTKGTLAQADELASRARRALRAGAPEEAARLAQELRQLLDAATAPDEKRSELLLSLANIYRGLRDVPRWGAAAQAALEVEERCKRPGMLGNHRMFYAMFLADQKRYAEAVTYGNAAIPCYEESLGPQHPETSRVRVDVEKFKIAAAANEN